MEEEDRNRMKKIVYVDMDNVLVDFRSGIAKLSDEDRIAFEGRYDDCPRIFPLMDPMPDAIESFHELAKHFDTYILSTAPWLNPAAWMHKVEWVCKYLGSDKNGPAYKRLILSHRKNLDKGHFLIDDRVKHGASEFAGEHIHFGEDPRFMNWKAVLDYLLPLA